MTFAGSIAQNAGHEGAVVVPGGGTVLLRCVPALEKLKLHDDEATGVSIVKRALEEPTRQM